MNTTRLLAGLGVVALVGLSACGSDSGGGGGATLDKIGDGEGSLKLVVWAGYAEDGSTDPNVNWVKPFTDESGCKVESKVGNSSDEMFQLMQTGEYDGVSASGDASVRLIDAGLVSPVDLGLFANYKDISPFLKDKPYNSKDGKSFGIPHGWGANLLMYRTDVVDPAPDSWGVVFDAESPYKGKITAYDSPIYIADASLYLSKSQPDLGITDPYALDQKQFDAAIALLKEQRGIIGEYWKDYAKNQQAFEQGSTVAGTAWQIIANLALANEAPVATVFPKEGSTAWSDTWMVSSKAKHPNCMLKWMDYITRPDVQAQVAEWFGEAPANPLACAKTSDPGHCDTFKAQDEAFYSSLAAWKTPRKECYDGRGAKCVPYAEWIKAWTEVKG